MLYINLKGYRANKKINSRCGLLFKKEWVVRLSCMILFTYLIMVTGKAVKLIIGIDGDDYK
jgi:hypothetical protein